MELGGGTTIAFATTGANTAVTAYINSIGGYTVSVGEVESTHLASTAMEYIPGDIPGHGEFAVEAQWDGTKDEIDDTAIASETITITPGAGGSIAGTGFIRDQEYPSFAINQPCLATLTVRWDGGTPPAFTKYV